MVADVDINCESQESYYLVENSKGDHQLVYKHLLKLSRLLIQPPDLHPSLGIEG